MQRSLMARFATRPAARFVAHPRRAREQRLGLARRPGFRAAAAGPTVLRRLDPGQVALLRADWRVVVLARPPRAAAGAAPAVRVHWAKLGADRAGRRPRAATAPWRG